MKLFAVVAQPPRKDAELQAVINDVYGKDVTPLMSGVWIVADEGTSKDVSDKVGITQSRVSAGVVLSVDGYFGHARTDLWEWLKVKSAERRNV